MPADPQQVKAIFLAAVEKSADERAVFLAEACGQDDALRQRVEQLLEAHELSGSLLNPRNASHTTSQETKMDAQDDVLAGLAPANRPGVLGMLDHYEVLEVVGSGGMGIVFKARDTKLQRIVAIKKLASKLAVDGTSRKRFVREAQAAAAVRDEHVVGIHAVCDEGPVTYLVMEFIGGTNLALKVKEHGPLELKEIL